ncbi:hypothetical protein [Lentzea sp. CA-135723]|uniref:hypothetical protein n=1 Tax=Lentzea sp. CA-135723 TaxID=3239950 RepID=UPI003D91CD01
MGRALGALLLLFVAACSAPPPPVQTSSAQPVTPPPAEPTTTEPKPPPGPPDWFELNPKGPGFVSYYPPQIWYRTQHPHDVVVKFRNAGDETLKAPVIRFEITPGSEGNGVIHTIVLNADGDGWTCETTRESATCRSAAELPPGEDLPQIDVGVVFAPEEDYLGSDMSDDLTVTYDDVVFKGTIRYDTST